MVAILRNTLSVTVRSCMMHFFMLFRVSNSIRHKLRHAVSCKRYNETDAVIQMDNGNICKFRDGNSEKKYNKFRTKVKVLALIC